VSFSTNIDVIWSLNTSDGRKNIVKPSIIHLNKTLCSNEIQKFSYSCDERNETRFTS